MLIAEQHSSWRVENGHVEVVRALLKHDKVDVNLQDIDGTTALCMAS
jgi:ankyrin repeat protein